MLLFFQSSGLCVQSSSTIPVPGYPQCLVPHLRSLDDRFSYPVVYILLSIYLWTCISHLDYRLHLLYLPLLLRTHINTGLSFSPISLHSESSVRIPSLVNNFGICFLPLGYLLLDHLLSGSILNHLMHSKDAECILMFLSAMPRGVSVAHIYVLKLPLYHL